MQANSTCAGMGVKTCWQCPAGRLADWVVGGAFFCMHDRTTAGHDAMHRTGPPPPPFRYPAGTQHVKVRDVNQVCKGAVLTWSRTATYDPVGSCWLVRCWQALFPFRLALACCAVAWLAHSGAGAGRLTGRA